MGEIFGMSSIKVRQLSKNRVPEPRSIARILSSHHRCHAAYCTAARKSRDVREMVFDDRRNGFHRARRGTCACAAMSNRSVSERYTHARDRLVVSIERQRALREACA